MQKFLSVAALLFSTGLAESALAECDFSQQVATCTGTLALKITDTAAPNYAAELTLTSSYPACSKIEYFLFNTPQTTILSGKSTSESLFGTKPISRSDLEISKCAVFKSSAGKTKPDGVVSNFDGVWTGIISDANFGYVIKHEGEITISVRSSQAQIRYNFGAVDGDFVANVKGGKITGTANIKEFDGVQPTKFNLALQEDGSLSVKSAGEWHKRSGKFKRTLREE